MNHDKRLFISPLLRKSVRLFVVIFLTIGALFSGILTLFYHFEMNTYLSELKEKEKHSLAVQKAQLTATFDSVIKTLFVLRDQNELASYLKNKNDTDLALIGEEYMSISTYYKVYDQIRFLDSQGMEIVRVNYNDGSPAVVPSHQLQAKAKRYYFTDAFALGEDMVFVSPFDLNIEHGQVEIPYKPMIRIATPAVDDQGKKQGIVLLNYLGNELIDRIIASEDISSGHSMLLNRAGYWLYHPDPAKSWGFMFTDKKDLTFATAYPNLWPTIRDTSQGQELTEYGLFTHITIHPLQSSTVTGFNTASTTDYDADQYTWHLISFIGSDQINVFSSIILFKLFSLGVGIFLFATAGSWFLAYSITKRRLLQARLKTMAYFDSLTDLPNRSHFFNRIEEGLAHAKRYNNKLALLYIDLDGFKYINDALGHDAGDTVLKIVAQRLQSVCRKSDTVARLGGDEFAVILPRIKTTDDIKSVAQKIIDTLGEPLLLEEQEGQIGASIGIALYPEDSIEVETLINLADSAMYYAKSQGKNQFIFHNQLD